MASLVILLYLCTLQILRKKYSLCVCLKCTRGHVGTPVLSYTFAVYRHRRPSGSIFFIYTIHLFVLIPMVHPVILFCWSVLCRHLLYVCPLQKKNDSSSVALAEVYSICFKKKKTFNREFSVIHVEGLMIERAICSTDRNAPRGNL